MDVIGIGGGSGSGKTVLASRLVKELATDVCVVPIDRYYRAFDEKNKFERMQVNFDHPDAIEWNLLQKHLRSLENGESVDMPVYSYEESTRTGYETVEAAPVIVVEGIFALYERLIERLDLAVYIAPDPDIRAIRRVRRDVSERNRSIEFAARQYLETTRIMHKKHIRPTKKHADINLDGINHDRFINKVKAYFDRKHQETDKSLNEFI